MINCAGKFHLIVNVYNLLLEFNHNIMYTCTIINILLEKITNLIFIFIN